MRALHPDIKIKDIHEWLNNKSINQVNAKVNKRYSDEFSANPQVILDSIMHSKLVDA